MLEYTLTDGQEPYRMWRMDGRIGPSVRRRENLGDSSFLRSKGMKRINKSVQNFLFFSILDRRLKLSFEIIFKWILTIKE
jgi:hypothetical protein